MNWQLIWESLKEPLREIVMAAIPGVLVYLQTLNATWAVVLYLIIRAIDSWLHEQAKADPTKTNGGILGLKGLTGF